MGRKNIFKTNEYLEYLTYLIEEEEVLASMIANKFNQKLSPFRNKMKKGFESKQIIKAERESKNRPYYYKINWEGLTKYFIKNYLPESTNIQNILMCEDLRVKQAKKNIIEEIKSNVIMWTSASKNQQTSKYKEFNRLIIKDLDQLFCRVRDSFIDGIMNSILLREENYKNYWEETF